MSKSKDRARAAAGQVIRNSQQVKMATCIVPQCGGHFVLEEGKLPLCSKHMDYLNFLVWALPRIRIEKQVGPGGIVLPGSPQFKATLEGKNP